MKKQSKKIKKHLPPPPTTAAETVKNPKKTSPVKFPGKSW
jgi:hypothetical protein